MFGTFAAAFILCAASAIVGEAAASVLRQPSGRSWSPAVGLALLVAVAAVAVELPGHGSTAAVAVALMLVVSLAALRRRRPSKIDPVFMAATGIMLVITCIPYLANGRFGILGVSFVNDSAVHLAWAVQVGDPGVAGASQPTPGYPVGPHSLLAGAHSGTGLGLDRLLAGLLMAVQLMITWTALCLLDRLRPVQRVLGAVLVASAYLLSATYQQAGFKETMLVLFLLAIVAALRDATRDPTAGGAASGVQLGVLGAAIVLTYSYGGLLWPILTVVAWVAMEVLFALRSGGIGAVLAGARRVVAPSSSEARLVMGAAGAGLVLLVPQLPDLIDQLRVFGTGPTKTGSIPETAVGHLAGRLPFYEIFGVWPRADFRFPLSPTLASSVAVGLGVAAALYGAVRWVFHQDRQAPAAFGATALIALYLHKTESPYIDSKGLAVAAPFAMLMSTRWLLDAPPRAFDNAVARGVQLLVAVAFAGAALYSSYLVLQGGQVGPAAHAQELDRLRPAMEGRSTLFLGFDNYVNWELRGVPLTLPASTIQSAKPAGQVATRSTKNWQYGDQFDFDSLRAADLDRVELVLIPRSLYQSEPPPNFRLAQQTASYELWERRGPTPPRGTLNAETNAPGAVLDCGRGSGRTLSRRRGWARVWKVKPRVVRLPEALAVAVPATTLTSPLRLPRGQWELSLAYTSPVGVTVSAGRSTRKMPANLDRPGPFWRVSETSGGIETVRFDLEDSGPIARPARTVALIGMAAVRTDARRELVPLDRACGRYVDWYVLGRDRPPVHRQGRAQTAAKQ